MIRGMVRMFPLKPHLFLRDNLAVTSTVIALLWVMLLSPLLYRYFSVPLLLEPLWNYDAQLAIDVPRSGHSCHDEFSPQTPGRQGKGALKSWQFRLHQCGNLMALTVPA